MLELPPAETLIEESTFVPVRGPMIQQAAVAVNSRTAAGRGAKRHGLPDPIPES
jgi:hypothetical protein